MLSQNLRSISSWLKTFVHDGVELAPEAVQGLLDVLSSAQSDAIALERMTMPIAATLPDMAPGITSDNLVLRPTLRLVRGDL